MVKRLWPDLLGADPMTDLAVLKLSMSDRPKKAKALKVATFGDSEKVEIGDVCFAVAVRLGFPNRLLRGMALNVALILPILDL